MKTVVTWSGPDIRGTRYAGSEAARAGFAEIRDGKIALKNSYRKNRVARP